ncbi:hypothetical protein J7E63_29460 [Bacillus sp. ISL-75]|uniref:hypothetical protein n=1 Tax=Bacillus sp. ISL-75 TaxID=2819137 RepID=UPI001BEA952B|nr:hypothetical protein [Bacillus sp. ISL-75]MBT2730941.1 hypothetical protein [Bacillus sp. ISL-75]
MSNAIISILLKKKQKKILINGYFVLAPSRNEDTSQLLNLEYATSYQIKADELKKDTTNLDAATASFTQGVEKLGKVFESEKLLPPSIDKQVN